MMWQLPAGQVTNKAALDPAAAAASNDTFNPADIANGTLSNGNRTFTQTSATARARSITSHSTGKYHIEFTVDVAGAGSLQFGFSTAGYNSSLGLDISGGAKRSVGASIGDGQRYWSGTSTAWSNAGDNAKWAWTAGDVIAVELDLDALTVRVQNFTQGSGWPVSPSGYLSLTGAASLPWFFEFLTSATGGQVTVNTGQAAYSVTPTAGFGDW